MKMGIVTESDTMYAKSKAWEHDYWLNDDFPSFLRWYARTDRKNAIQHLGVNDIIDIVEKPYRINFRQAYEEFLIYKLTSPELA